MRILFLTRLHPLKKLGAIESRLHDRVTELSELGHEVLVLTKWTGDPVDFELPDRIEIRSPFKTFRPWEWPRALPMVFAWRPDLLHVFDPGLSKIERSVSVEMIAMTMLDTMSRASRGRSSFRGSLVSMIGSASQEAQTSWKRAGATITESGWLQPIGAEKGFKPWDLARGRRLRIVIAGQIGEDHPLEVVLNALQVMRSNADFELTVFLDRTTLSGRDRSRLARAERMETTIESARGEAVGGRLHVSADDLTGDSAIKTAEDFDLAIVAGLEVRRARSWIERLVMPVVLSETHGEIVSELERSGMRSQILGPLVTEIAPIEQALNQALNRTKLEEAWQKIQRGELAGGRDVAANYLSRIYSQIVSRRAGPTV